MKKTTTLPLGQRALVLMSGTVVGTAMVVGLWWGRPVLIPIALAILLTFLLNPLVKFLQARGLNRVFAVMVAVALAATVVMGIGTLVTRQVASMMAELPQKTANIADKAKRLRQWISGGQLKQFEQMMKDVNRELQPSVKPSTETRPDDRQEPSDAPETVDKTVVVQPEPTPWLSLTGYLNSAFEVLATLALALVLLVFFLLGREDLRDRIVVLAGKAHLALTSKALEDITERISRYLILVALLNGGFGVLLTIGLLILGVPYALLWGFLAGALRFIPYLGPWIGASFPIVMSFAVSEGWWQPFAVFGYVLTLELISNNAVEPLVFGRSIGVSPTALLISAAFWFYIWGSIGLVLSAPIAVCLLVLGKNIPQLHFLNLLLGDAPALSAEASLYQRLMLADQLAAKARIAEHLKNNSPDSIYDELLVPALNYARRDSAREHLSDEDFETVVAGIGTCLAELKTIRSESDSQESGNENVSADAVPSPPLKILGCPARDETDSIALEMLGQLLDANHWDLEILSADNLTSEIVSRLQDDPPAVICISSLPPGGLPQTRYLCKRLRDAAPGLIILVGCWGLKRNAKLNQERLEQAGASLVATTMLEARKLLESRWPVLCAHTAALTNHDGNT